MKVREWKRSWRYVAVGLALIAAAWALRHPSLSAASSEGAEGESERLLPVRTVSVRWQSGYEVEERFLGQLETARRSELAFELPGTLVNVAVDEGDRVRQGETLAVLDTARLQALRKEQEAILAEAKASLRLAEATFERTARLETSGAVSTQDLDRVTQARDTAAASVARVEAALERIGVDLSKSRLMAPYDGHIAVRRVDEGAMVQPGSSVLEIIESGVLEARIGLPQAVVADIEVGEPALLQRAASGEPLSAEIARLSPRHDERRRTVDVLLAIRQEVALLDGELVEWPMTREIAGRGAWLPRSALTASVRGLWAVYVTLPLNDSRQRELERREVELIHIAGDRVFVRGTLRESEGVGPEGIEVVAEGLQRLVPGQRVEVVSGDASSRETVVTR